MQRSNSLNAPGPSGWPASLNPFRKTLGGALTKRLALSSQTLLGCTFLVMACQNNDPKPKADPEPDPSAWLAPPSAPGVSALPETAEEAPKESEPTASANANPAENQPKARPVRAKDLPPIFPAPTERDKSPELSSINLVMASYGFPPHQSLEHLCAQRVYEGSGGHLTWDAFSSSLDPQALLVAYRSKLGEAGLQPTAHGGTWRLPANAEPPLRVLDILPISAGGPHRGCEKSPPANAKSILIVSRRH